MLFLVIDSVKLHLTAFSEVLIMYSIHTELQRAMQYLFQEQSF